MYLSMLSLIDVRQLLIDKLLFNLATVHIPPLAGPQWLSLPPQQVRWT